MTQRPDPPAKLSLSGKSEVAYGEKTGSRRWLAVASRPRSCFFIALMVLLSWHTYCVVSDPHFLSPPKPVGDGPDYENIAFHLSTTGEYRFSNASPSWRQLYENATPSGPPLADDIADTGDPGSKHDVYAAQLTAPLRNFLSTSRPPVLPATIAATYALMGRNSVAFASVRLLLAAALAITGALSVWLTATVLRSMFAGRSIIVCASLATLALNLGNATLRSYATDFLTEPFALLFLQLFLTSLVVGWSSVTGPKHRRRWEIGAGIALGLMILVRSIFIVWLPLLVVLLYFAAPEVISYSSNSPDSGRRPNLSSGTKIRSSLIVLGIAVLICAPWWIRNCLVLERIAPLGTQGAITLAGGYCDEAFQARGEWQPGPEQRLRSELISEPAFVEASNDTARESIVSREAGRRVQQWIREHWRELPQLFWMRVTTHWNPYTGKSLVWKTLMLFGLLALARSRARSRFEATRAVHSQLHPPGNTALLLLLGLPLISTLTAGLLYTAGGRFLVPCYGVLFSLSGIGVAWLLHFLNAFRRSASDSPNANGH